MFSLTSIVVALVSLETVMGGPVKYPEVVPGPGLPSLAEIGVTSAELYQMGMPDASSLPRSLEARFDARCGPSDYAYTNVNGIIACYNYLRNLGHQSCKTPSGLGIAHFCYSGGAEVSGQALVSTGAASYCSDVAIAVLYTVDHCTRPDQSCAGFQAANGNGNLIVGATSKNYVGS